MNAWIEKCHCKSRYVITLKIAAFVKFLQHAAMASAVLAVQHTPV